MNSAPDPAVAALVARGKYAPAVELLKDRVARERHNAPARMQLADLLVLAGRGPEAIPVFLDLADEFAADGFATRAIALLKKIEKIDANRKDVEQRLESLLQASRRAGDPAKPAARAPVSHAAEMIEMPPETATPRDRVAALYEPGPLLSYEEPARPRERVRETPQALRGPTGELNLEDDPVLYPDDPDLAPAAEPEREPEPVAAQPEPDPEPAAAEPEPEPEPAPSVPAEPEPEEEPELVLRSASQQAQEDAAVESAAAGAAAADTEVVDADELDPEPEVELEPEAEAAAAAAAEPGEDAPKPPIETALFEGLTNPEALALVQGLELIHFEAGDVILTQGDEVGSLFIITAGVVKTFVREPPDRRHVLVRTLHAGEFFGEMALLSGKPRSATLTAATACEVLELEPATLAEITRIHPRVREVLENVFIERVSTQAERMEQGRGRGRKPSAPKDPS